MKNVFLTIMIILSMSLASCNDESKPVPEGFTGGMVVETFNSGGYTYMRLEQKSGEVWIAASEMPIKVHDTVYYNGGVEMKNFHSKTLNKTFNSIFFVELVTKDPWALQKQEDEIPSGMGSMGKSNPQKNVTADRVSGITVEPLQDGYTIGNIWKNKASLSGKTVKVRGQVVKFNANILSTNWVHIQDGTGDDKGYDLAVTTSETFNVGDVVVLEGIVVLDKDFGAGYKYTLLLEKAVAIKGMNKI